MPKDYQDETGDKRQDRYTVDLTVLGTEKLEVYDPNLNGKDDGGTVVYDTPYTFKGMWMFGAGVIPKIKGAHENPKTPLLLGVVRRCPQSAGYKEGKTPDDVDRVWDHYVANVAKGAKKPQFSWGFVDPTDAERAVALAWYRGQ